MRCDLCSYDMIIQNIDQFESREQKKESLETPHLKGYVPNYMLPFSSYINVLQGNQIDWSFEVYVPDQYPCLYH